MTLPQIPDWINTSLGEFTVGWLVLSALLGGILSAIVKLLFEIIAPARIKDISRRRRIRRQVGPVLHSAVSDLEARLNRIFFDSRAQEWLSEDIFSDIEQGNGFLKRYHDGFGYFALSTIYSILRLLASMELVRRLASKPDMFDLEDLIGDYNWIVRGLDSLRVDEPITKLKISRSGRDCRVLTRHIQASLGDFLISEKGDHSSIQSFVEFVQHYKSDSEFRHWVKCVEGYVRGLDTSIDSSAIGNSDQRLVRLASLAYFLALYLERTPRSISGKRRTNELNSAKYLKVLGLWEP